MSIFDFFGNQLNCARFITVVNNIIMFDFPACRSKFPPVCHNAVQTVGNRSAGQGADMYQNCCLLGFLNAVSLHLLHHLLANLCTCLQVVGKESCIVIIAAQCGINQKYRQLLLAQSFRTCRHIGAVRRSKYYCVRLFAGKLFNHIALQLPVAVLHNAADINVNVSLSCSVFNAADNFFPIVTLHNLEHSIDVFASFLNFCYRLKILLSFGVHNLLCYRALLRIVAAAACNAYKQ